MASIIAFRAKEDYRWINDCPVLIHKTFNLVENETYSADDDLLTSPAFCYLLREGIVELVTPGDDIYIGPLSPAYVPGTLWGSCEEEGSGTTGPTGPTGGGGTAAASWRRHFMVMGG